MGRARIQAQVGLAFQAVDFGAAGLGLAAGLFAQDLGHFGIERAAGDLFALGQRAAGGKRCAGGILGGRAVGVGGRMVSALLLVIPVLGQAIIAQRSAQGGLELVLLRVIRCGGGGRRAAGQLLVILVKLGIVALAVAGIGRHVAEEGGGLAVVLTRLGRTGIRCRVRCHILTRRRSGRRTPDRVVDTRVLSHAPASRLGDMGWRRGDGFIRAAIRRFGDLEPGVPAIGTLDIAPFGRNDAVAHLVLRITIRANQSHLRPRSLLGVRYFPARFDFIGFYQSKPVNSK
ncbi:hypothetical protein ATO5_08950 [Loktanella sp. 22II-4b]|nr:hypothetical protein ATO5_08950 [Loktanella sp. 22II-4b]